MQPKDLLEDTLISLDLWPDSNWWIPPADDFTNLPPLVLDLWLSIFEFLHPQEQLYFLGTCTLLRQQQSKKEDSLLWFQIRTEWMQTLLNKEKFTFSGVEIAYVITNAPHIPKDDYDYSWFGNYRKVATYTFKYQYIKHPLAGSVDWPKRVEDVASDGYTLWTLPVETNKIYSEFEGIHLLDDSELNISRHAIIDKFDCCKGLYSARRSNWKLFTDSSKKKYDVIVCFKKFIFHDNKKVIIWQEYTDYLAKLQGTKKISWEEFLEERQEK